MRCRLQTFCIGNSNEEAMNDICQPVLYRRNVTSDEEKLNHLLKENPHIIVSDEIESQLMDLIELRFPAEDYTQKEIKELVQQHLGDTSMQDYGVWVYYPWSYRLVHLLDEKEFIELRTNRNRNKITLEEAAVLDGKKVGVIGLSVGQSVSVTMAMERSFNEIRIADFDRLELTNLNRIRSGVHNLGLLKCTMVAREIAEIDPFLKVVCYNEGITEENIEDFLTKGGKLDAVIDECDGLDVKILCRVKSKAHGIPVLMEASDRGTIDIERYDLEPDRPLLHGFIEHLDINKVKGLKTNEEKIPYLMPIAGMETLSPRMKASMLEIGETLTTWPQLAAAVTYGGGITADTYRRMMLGHFTKSGRYFVDLEEIIPEEDSVEGPVNNPYNGISWPEPLDILKMDAILENVPTDSTIKFTPEQSKKLVEAAAWAPSGGNCQPWKWREHHGELFLFHDWSRSFSFSDFHDIGSKVSFGAALHNLRLTGRQLGLLVNEELYPLGSESQLIARISIKEQIVPEEINTNVVLTRHTNRKKGDSRPIDQSVLNDLMETCQLNSHTRLEFITHKEHLHQLGNIVSEAERLRILHPQGHYDFYQNEVRWNQEEAERTGDGIDINTIELTPSELAGMKIASDPNVIDLLRSWKGGKAFEKLSRDGIASSSAIGLFTIPNAEDINIIKGGIDVQRTWLHATDLNISIHPVSAALFMFARINSEKDKNLDQYSFDRLSRIQEQFTSIVKLNSRYPLFMIRLFYASEPSVQSERLPLSEVYFPQVT